MHKIRFIGLLCLLAQILSGCGLHSSGIDLGVREHLELSQTPFFPQEKYQCGPASLAMVLGFSGINVLPDELVPRIYVPGRKGSFQVELMAAARSYKRIPYLLEPRLNAIVEELRAGRPVLVLQNYGLESLPSYHYAVVVGMSPENEVILRSGTERRHVMGLSSFLMSWLRPGAWAMVVLRPEELVQRPDINRYLKAVAAFERVNGARTAYPAYRTASSTWPENPLSLFALGNNALKRQAVEEAEELYRQTLLIDDTHIGALNNLADLLARKGCFDEAKLMIERAVKQVDNSATVVAKLVLSTQGEIDRMKITAPSATSCK